MPFVYHEDYFGYMITFRVKALSQTTQSIYAYTLCEPIQLNESMLHYDNRVMLTICILELPNPLLLQNRSYNITMNDQKKQHEVSFTFSTLGHSYPIFSSYSNLYNDKYELSLNCCQSGPLYKEVVSCIYRDCILYDTILETRTRIFTS